MKYETILEYVKANRSVIENYSPAQLRKIQKEKNFPLADFIRVLRGFGIDKLNPQSQKEHNDIFGYGDGFGGHLYSDNGGNQ